jgi:hypothetical protein
MALSQLSLRFFIEESCGKCNSRHSPIRQRTSQEGVEVAPLHSPEIKPHTVLASACTLVKVKTTHCTDAEA